MVKLDVVVEIDVDFNCNLKFVIEKLKMLLEFWIVL